MPSCFAPLVNGGLNAMIAALFVHDEKIIKRINKYGFESNFFSIKKRLENTMKVIIYETPGSPIGAPVVNWLCLILLQLEGIQ